MAAVVLARSVCVGPKRGSGAAMNASSNSLSAVYLAVYGTRSASLPLIYLRRKTGETPAELGFRFNLVVRPLGLEPRNCGLRVPTEKSDQSCGVP